MPTSGTHITVIERLALRPEWRPLLGDPYADASDPAGMQMRYAKLGAVGPDLLYALLDYGPGLQDFSNFLAKSAGAIACIGDLFSSVEDFTAKVESEATVGISEQTKHLYDEIEGTFGTVSTVVNEGLLALLVDKGYNFFTIFQPQREKDAPRAAWYWADYLHYVRTGEFVRQLFVLAGNDPNRRAYAYGYLSHYVTDVVGHPYVNQVTGAPWRLYWQRHHLVENYIDAYVWPRWHDAQKGGGGEPPLDRIRATPNPDASTGARYTYSRLNDHIDVGDPAGTDGVDALVMGICKKIRLGLEDVGIAEPNPVAPGNAAFVGWTQYMAQAIRAAYPTTAVPPTNLAGNGRPDGYPTADDIGAAYSLYRLALRFATEDPIEKPKFPDVIGDVWAAVQHALQKVADDFAGITPPPHFGSGKHFSWKSLWNSVKAWARTAAEAAVALAKAALDVARGLIQAAGALALDMLKAVLYVVKLGLWSLYRVFRAVLVRLAYAAPYTGELAQNVVADLPASTLFVSPGNVPRMMFEMVERETVALGAPYSDPYVAPQDLPEYETAQAFEMGPVFWAPYPSGSHPEAFLDAPLGSRGLVVPGGGTPPDNVGPVPLTTAAAGHVPVDSFGGAVAACEAAFAAVRAANHAPPAGMLPDYNLDGDRGYAWPCWDVAPGTKLRPPVWGATVQVSPTPIPSAPSA